MSEQERLAFLGAIAKDPSVAPIFADWLDDRGQGEEADWYREPCVVAADDLAADRFRRFVGEAGYTLWPAHPARALSGRYANWNGVEAPQVPYAVVRHGRVAEVCCPWRRLRADAPRLFALNPVRDVFLPECRPVPVPGPGARFTWWCWDAADPATSTEVFAQLRGSQLLTDSGRKTEAAGARYRAYPSAFAARKAMSAVCVALCRKLAEAERERG